MAMNGSREDTNADGDVGEEVLDQFFSNDFNIYTVTLEDQYRGIDRVFEARDGRRYTVEYKTDWEADKYGNIFVEFLANDLTGRLGWAITCEADFLIVYVPGTRFIYITRPQRIRQVLREWKLKYKGKPSSKGNTNYLTWGVPVPHKVFESAAEKTLEFPVSVKRGAA